jgi:Putative addiction module component
MSILRRGEPHRDLDATPVERLRLVEKLWDSLSASDIPDIDSGRSLTGGNRFIAWIRGAEA